MALTVLTSRTIRGITYQQGDSFTCAYSAGGNGGSEGDGVSAAALTKGNKYYFLGYVVAADSGSNVVYPCKIGSSSSTSSTIGYYKEEVFPYATYKITYNANGGSGAPSAQTKTYGTALTLSGTKPTRTGYTFKCWNTKSDGSGTNYNASASYTANSATTLYAIWTEHMLTVNYYSNYATSAFADALSSVGSDKNVKVWVSEIYYDNDYSTYGLANYSNSSGSVYMTRTGYTATGKWGTSTSGGTLVDEDTTFATGQAIAKALGKDLSSGNASINVYAQWTENKLTVNLYSNYADYGTYQGNSLNVSASTNVVVYTKEYLYNNAYSDGLSDVQNEDYLYLKRTGYTPTHYWGTSTSGGTLLDEKKSYSSGQALAEDLGKSIKTGNATVNLYAQWKANNYTLTLNANGGTPNAQALTLTYNVGDYWGIEAYTPTRLGYTFLGWYTSANGGIKVYDDKGLCINEGTYWKNNTYIYPNNLTLYAQWKPSGVVYIDDGTTFNKYLVYIDNGSSWDLYLPYIDDGTSWNIIS